MKKFKFRLEKVLNFRKLVKDEKKRELGRRLAVLHDAQNKLGRLDEAQRNNRLASECILHVEMLVMHALYGARLLAEIASQKELILKCEEEVDVARGEYVEASKEVEVLEKLKGRQHQEYVHDMDLAEGRMLDEFGVQRSGKQYF